jgi:hypothetical protein
MAMKIKWNDDRVRETATALLLISRDRLRRGATNDLIKQSLDDFRRDPARYKANRAAWAPAAENGPLTIPRDLEYYAKLRATVGRLMEKMVQGKRQFNSLSELDNFLVFTLDDPR